MRAERKSAATIASYSEGVLGFLRWAKTANVTPEITKTNVQGFTAELLDNGAQAATARARHMALRRLRGVAGRRGRDRRQSSARCQTPEAG